MKAVSVMTVTVSELDYGSVLAPFEILKVYSSLVRVEDSLYLFVL